LRVRSRLGSVVAVALSLVPAACAHLDPTGYVPYREGYGAYEGYQELPIDPTTVKVVYWWNTATTPARGEDLLLYRCADVTLQRGFDVFTSLETHDGYRIIRLSHGPRPGDGTDSFDAREILQTIGPRLGLPTSPSAAGPQAEQKADGGGVREWRTAGGHP
jgi:hypothetical protein